MIFAEPTLTETDHSVIDEIAKLRQDLSVYINETPRRWIGHLRRMTLARAVRGSNWIEGYRASLDDVLDTLEDDEPREANTETALALAGYRDAMTYILQLSQTDVVVDETLIKALHYMMIKHELAKRPGLYRLGPVWVEDEDGIRVYEAPDVTMVPALMDELLLAVNENAELPPMVRAALAHLNLVMIHPFRDGNGRMARALQTLVLAREGVVSPEFSSIEEYLGRNAEAYYAILTEVGQGSWNPERTTRSWIRFSLTAHYRQAWTVRRRVDETETVYDGIEQLVRSKGLPTRAVGPLADAARGRRLRRSSYTSVVELTAGEEISDLTASRDLKILTETGALVAHGQGRGRTYTGAASVTEIWERIRAGRPPRSQDDPYVTFGDQQPLPGLSG